MQRVRKGLATWLTSSSTPIFLLDHRKVVLVFNHGCEEITGWSAADVIGKKCELVNQGNPELIETLTSAMSPPESVLQGESMVVPVMLQPREGKSERFGIHFFPLPQEDSTSPSRVLGVFSRSVSSGIELVPPSLVRRFEVSKLLVELHEKYSLNSLITGSAAMERVAAQAKAAAENGLSVHLIGEEGVGKEHVARLIHYASFQGDARFLPIDCSQLSHFEVSRSLRRVFEQAQDSEDRFSVYLQNVDHLSRDLQVEINDQLNEIDSVRWFSSSRQKLEELDSEVFETDLLCRLTHQVVSIPPLRERQAGLPFLVSHLVFELNRELKTEFEGVSEGVLEEFKKYHWPGNVDELMNVLTIASKTGSGTVLELEDLPLSFRANRDSQSVRTRLKSQTLDQILEATEKEVILEVLEAVNGNKSLAAEVLNVPRAKLYRRISALGIELEQGGPLGE